MAEPLQGILVGLGGRGRYWLGNGLRHPDVEWIACVEPVAELRAGAASAGAPAGALYPTLAEALDATKGRAAFVMDVTPPAMHEQIAMETFAAGLHLIGEKPMSDDFAAALRIVEAGRKAGIVHMITQNYRFGAQPRTSRRLLDGGLVGDIGHIDVSFYMPWADREGTHYVTQPYMFTKDMGIHHFDMLRYVLGREPVTVQCVTWNPAWAWHKGDASHLALFTFEGGVRAVHRGVGCSNGTRTTWNGDWRIEGPAGTVTWEGPDMYYTRLHRTDHPQREQIFPDPSPVPAGHDPLLTEFVAAIRAGRQPECNASDNIRSLAMVEGCVRSSQQHGREVQINELLSAS